MKSRGKLGTQLRTVGGVRALGWSLGRKTGKGDSGGIQQESFLNSRKDVSAYCRHPPSPIVQTLVLFLPRTQRRETSVFYTPTDTFQGTHLLCPNAPAPKCQVVSPSGAHTPDQHLSDRQARVDGNTAHASAHGHTDMPYLKDIYVLFTAWHSARESSQWLHPPSAVTSHSVPLSRVSSPRYSCMSAHPNTQPLKCKDHKYCQRHTLTCKRGCLQTLGSCVSTVMNRAAPHSRHRDWRAKEAPRARCTNLECAPTQLQHQTRSQSLRGLALSATHSHLMGKSHTRVSHTCSHL